MAYGELKTSGSKLGASSSQRMMQAVATITRAAKMMVRRRRSSAMAGSTMSSAKVESTIVILRRRVRQIPEPVVDLLKGGLEADRHRVARPRQVDRHFRLDPPRPAGEHNHPIRQRDRLFEVMSNEHDRLARALPQP